jgi:hypothetical protein
MLIISEEFADKWNSEIELLKERGTDFGPVLLLGYFLNRMEKECVWLEKKLEEIFDREQDYESHLERVRATVLLDFVRALIMVYEKADFSGLEEYCMEITIYKTFENLIEIEDEEQQHGN